MSPDKSEATRLADALEHYRSGEDYQPTPATLAMEAIDKVQL